MLADIVPAVLGHYTFCHSQAEAGAVGVEAGRHECIEDAGKKVGGDAGAVVLHAIEIEARLFCDW